MGTTTRHRDLEKRVQPEMPFFAGMNEEDRRAIVAIYQIKLSNNELDSKEASQGVEEVAKLYHAQKCAFQDVLTKEGFDICSEVPKTYAGRIAILTYHGTLVVLSKEDTKGRHIVMTRIHSPKLSHNNERGHLTYDLKLRERTRFQTSKGEYNGSPTRALAVNPHGANGDELESARSISENIHEASFKYLIKKA